LEDPQLAVPFGEDVSSVVATSIDVDNVPEVQLTEQSFQLPSEAVRTPEPEGG
jgi:hypothetical protein